MTVSRKGVFVSFLFCLLSAHCFKFIKSFNVTAKIDDRYIKETERERERDNLRY